MCVGRKRNVYDFCGDDELTRSRSRSPTRARTQQVAHPHQDVSMRNEIAAEHSRFDIDVDIVLNVNALFPGFPHDDSEEAMIEKVSQARALVAAGDPRLSPAEIAWMVKVANRCLDNRIKEETRQQLLTFEYQDQEPATELNPLSKDFFEHCVTLRNELVETHFTDQVFGDQLDGEGHPKPYRTKLEAKNALEQYCMTVRNNMLQESQVSDRFEADGQAAVDSVELAVWRTLDWLCTNDFAEVDEIEAKQKELEGVVNDAMPDGSVGY